MVEKMFNDDIEDREMYCKFGTVLMIIGDKDEPENEYKWNASNSGLLHAIINIAYP